MLVMLCAADAATNTASACSCYVENIRERLLSADIVFEGTVVSSAISDDSDEYDQIGTTRFSVARQIKGRPQTSIDIMHSTASSVSCGVRFSVGEQRLVFANLSGDALFTSSCGLGAWIDSEGNTAYIEETSQAVMDADNRDDREDALREFEWSTRFDQQDKDAVDFVRRYLRHVESVRDPEFEFWSLSKIEFLEHYQDWQNVSDSLARRSEYLGGSAPHLVAAGEAALKAEEWTSANEYFERAIELDRFYRPAKEGRAKARLYSSGQFSLFHADYRSIAAPNLDAAGQSTVLANLSRTSIREVDLSGARIFRLTAADATWSRPTLTSAWLPSAQFQDARLQSVNAHNAHLAGANFTGTFTGPGNFRGANLRGASLQRIEAWRADFSGANLQNADLRNARLSSTLLLGTDLRNAKLEGAHLTAARIDCATQLPRGADVRGLQLIPVEPECNGVPTNRDFSGQSWGGDFRELDLQGAQFHEADFRNGARFFGADLRQAQFTNATGYADFRGADLSDADLRTTDFWPMFTRKPWSLNEETTYGPTILDRANFRGAQLETTSFLGEWDHGDDPANLSTALFDDVSVVCDNEYSRDVQEQGPEYKPYGNETPEDIAVRSERRRREFEIASRWLANERALVRDIAARFPTATFSEGCDIHYDEPLEEAGAAQ